MPDLAGHTYTWVPGEDPAAPALLLLHGTGADERDLLPLGARIGPGSALLSPRGLVREHGMNRWFRRLAEGVFDTDDLVARAADLAAFVRTASAEHGIPPGGAVAVGFSNGANMAAALLLLHPGLLRGAVLLSAMLPLQPERLPDLTGTVVLMGAGRIDPMAPPDRAEALARLLREAGADVDLHWHDHGHGVDPAQIELVRAWLDEVRTGASQGTGSGS